MPKPRQNEIKWSGGWADKLSAFLQFNEHEILQNTGRVSKEVADKLAVEQYEKYNQNRLEQPVDSDFDVFIKKNSLPNLLWEANNSVVI